MPGQRWSATVFCAGRVRNEHHRTRGRRNELLADRGLQLFLDSSVGPCSRNRHGIGYVSRNTELIRLAHLVLDDAAEIGTHPVVLATQWIMAGFSPDVAAAVWGTRPPRLGNPITR